MDDDVIGRRRDCPQAGPRAGPQADIWYAGSQRDALNESHVAPAPTGQEGSSVNYYSIFGPWLARILDPYPLHHAGPCKDAKGVYRSTSAKAAMVWPAKHAAGELPARARRGWQLTSSAPNDQLNRLKVEIPDFVICPGYTGRFASTPDAGGRVYVAGATGGLSHTKTILRRWASKADTDQVKWWLETMKDKSIEPVTVSRGGATSSKRSKLTLPFRPVSPTLERPRL